VTAKLCKSAKGARAAEMGLRVARHWTEGAFRQELGPKVGAIATTLTGMRNPLNRRMSKVFRPGGGRHLNCYLPERWPERTSSRSLGRLTEMRKSAEFGKPARDGGLRLTDYFLDGSIIKAV
jgi:hypothetical protein